MALIVKPKTWSDNENVLYTDLNAVLDTLYNAVNGNLNDANISSLQPSKIAGTAATISGSETLSNKTLSKPTFNASVQLFTTDTDGSTVTFNLGTSNLHTVVLGGNRVLSVANASIGQAFVVRLTQDATGSRTVTWFTTIKWAGGNTPVLTTAANKTDVFGFLCTASGAYDGFIIGQNL